MAENDKVDNAVVNRTDKADNTKDGLFLGSVENWTPKDPKSIGPNGKRPLEVGNTKHLFGSWSD